MKLKDVSKKCKIWADFFIYTTKKDQAREKEM